MHNYPDEPLDEVGEGDTEEDTEDMDQYLDNGACEE